MKKKKYKNQTKKITINKQTTKQEHKFKKI